MSRRLRPLESSATQLPLSFTESRRSEIRLSCRLCGVACNLLYSVSPSLAYASIAVCKMCLDQIERIERDGPLDS
jgi:hypothetical protein